MRIIASALSLLAIAAWGYLTSIGISAIHSIAEQHASGYPNVGQIGLFILVPLLVSSLLAVGAVRVNRRGSDGWLLAAVAIGSLFCAPAFLMFYAGGV